MPDNTQNQKKRITPDWLVQGALTRIGDTFDKLTGRGWRPSSSLATSGLIERLKTLLDAEIKVNSDGQKFVPHNIKLKMQWDKFSTDSDTSLRKLEHELLTAAVDHISDNRYYTYAPLQLEAKPDYFTQGVKLFVSFDEFHEEDGDAELNVTVPAMNVAHLIPDTVRALASGTLVARYDPGTGPVEKTFTLKEGTRLSAGRTKENDIAVDHTSVSKMHASLLLNAQAKLVVADTGSTNGTYLNGERIAYGKAIELAAGDKLKFGAIDIELNFTADERDGAEVSPDAPTEAFNIGDFQFSKKTEVLQPAVTADRKPANPAETEPEKRR